MKEADSPEFKQYIRAVKTNAKALAFSLIDKGYTICTGGTENHLVRGSLWYPVSVRAHSGCTQVLWDLRPQGLTGSKMEKLCEAVRPPTPARPLRATLWKGRKGGGEKRLRMVMLGIYIAREGSYEGVCVMWVRASLTPQVHISLNKNAVHGDQSAAVPGGVRLGTPAMTTRGLDEADFEKVRISKEWEARFLNWTFTSTTRRLPCLASQPALRTLLSA